MANVDPRTLIDLDIYLRGRADVRNMAGGRAYAYGVRTFHCPFCGDDRERGWMNVVRWSAGCYNVGCAVNPRAEGAIAWIMRREGFSLRGQVWVFLLETSQGLPARASAPAPTHDFVILPPSVPLLVETRPGVVVREAHDFAKRQWGLFPATCAQWALMACLTGPHAWRIIIPIHLGRQLVSFVSRTFRNGEPKYLSASALATPTRPAECGRQIGDVLFGLDAVQPGDTVVLVEGVGDVMAWSQRQDPRPAVGLLGVALTPTRLALLVAKRPAQIIVALDTAPDTVTRIAAVIEDTLAWGVPAVPGRWVGGKDAGTGAGLAVEDAQTLTQRIAGRLQEPHL